MDAVTLLEQLAQNAHHHSNNKELLNMLPEKIRAAFLEKNIESIKQQLSDTDHFANEQHVFQLNQIILT